jgi:hypothetical protein
MNPSIAENVLSWLAGARAGLMTSALFVICFVPSTEAGTLYTYTGNAYSSCSGTYCTGGPYALSVTFETTLTGNALHNLPFTDITPTITSFSFIDGSGLTVNEHTIGGYTNINVSTNATGDIVTWLTGGYGPIPSQVQMQTNWSSPFGFIPGADFSETTASFAGSYGMNYNLPGTWVMVTSANTPDPSAATLLGTGLLGLLALAARRKGLARWSSHR